MNTISSRMPEGLPNQCPLCFNLVCVEPSQPPGDAPCPHCGTLLWFSRTAEGFQLYDYKDVSPVSDRIIEIVYENLGVSKEQVTSATFFIKGIGADSLDIVELVMELEEAFEVTIPDDQAEKIKTIGEVIDYIIRKRRDEPA